MPALDSTAEVTSLLEIWEKDFNISEFATLLNKTATTPEGVELTLVRILVRCVNVLLKDLIFGFLGLVMFNKCATWM